MPSRIVVFGATGYTGRLTAERLVAQGAQPVLAGRSGPRLAELAERLGGLEWRVADVDRPASVAALLEDGGGVLVSTVGPFKRWGEPAVRAAITGGAVYLDSTGEPAFIRRVFDEFGPAAGRADATLLTAMGYDFVPGTLAGALALDAAARGGSGDEPSARGEAGDEPSGRGTAARVDIGYYVLGGGPGALSRGTRASLVGVSLDASFAFRAGRMTTVRSAERVRSFAVRGRDRPGISVGGAEHFTLPDAYPQLREVNVYLGWFGGLARAAQASARASALATKVPGVRRALELGGNRLAGMGAGPAPGTTPGTTSHVVAVAYDVGGEPLAEVQLAGADGYAFTAGCLAWAARRALREGVAATGAVGPLAAFGLEALEAGCAEAGLARV